MRVVLSRKGMDSASGGIASPVLPDGTLLSLPIPDPSTETAYKALSYKGHRFDKIIRQLSPKFDFMKNQNCHLDPDIYDDIEGRPDEWKPAFGQYKISARHLDKQKVGVGDIFLFYGMFKQTEYQPGCTLSYVRNAPIRHIIYGYMKIGKILQEQQEITACYSWHPHSKAIQHAYNRLYLPETYGTFHYSDSLVLTKQGQENRRLWTLPAFFAENGISISWQGNNRPVLVGEYAELNTARRGQEFVVTASAPELDKKLCDWVDSLMQDKTADD